MAQKNKTVYVCGECGYESPKWMGQCICGAWNSFVEERVLPVSASAGIASSGRGTTDLSKAVRVKQLKDVAANAAERIDTGISELNRVLGGGIVRGSVTLFAGEPGIGKSTLILQTAMSIASRGLKALYVSGEESEEQIRMRADRITGDIPDGLYFLSETNIENIAIRAEDMKPDIIIIDSVQTMYTDTLESSPGSVSQVRACAASLVREAKQGDTPVFIIAHVTKSGELAGPKTIEHIVDCVLYFSGERLQDIRIVRANKNRFGTTSEIGAFEMQDVGLIEVVNLSGALLENMSSSSEGTIAAAVYEGTRPIALEIQALTASGGPGFGRRTAIGFDVARLNMLIAVLERKLRLDLTSNDVYVNVVGGIKPEGTSLDLAVALAIWSSAKAVPIQPRVCAAGEVGLSGELRSVRGLERIANETARLGFNTLILPSKDAKKIKAPQGLKLRGADDITDAAAILSCISQLSSCADL